MNYRQQLKDKRWKTLSKLIKSRDKCCIYCKCTKKLHTHHTEYHKDKLAWEYDLCYLVTLCSTCHKKEHINNDIPVKDNGIIIDYILSMKSKQILKKKKMDKIKFTLI